MGVPATLYTDFPVYRSDFRIGVRLSRIIIQFSRISTHISRIIFTDFPGCLTHPRLILWISRIKLWIFRITLWISPIIVFISQIILCISRIILRISQIITQISGIIVGISGLSYGFPGLPYGFPALSYGFSRIIVHISRLIARISQLSYIFPGLSRGFPELSHEFQRLYYGFLRLLRFWHGIFIRMCFMFTYWPATQKVFMGFSLSSAADDHGATFVPSASLFPHSEQDAHGVAPLYAHITPSLRIWGWWSRLYAFHRLDIIALSEIDRDMCFSPCYGVHMIYMLDL